MPEVTPAQLNTELSQLDGELPIALFPLKLQTRFATPNMVAALGKKEVPQPESGELPTELWVRIYPDDIFLDTLESEILEEEFEAAKSYWNALWKQAASPDRLQEKQATWRSLSEAFGPVRARLLLKQTRPINGIDQAGFPEAEPSFPEPSLASDSWTRAAHTYLLPDRFIISLEKGGSHRQYAGNPIQKTEEAVTLGLDPSSLDHFEDGPEGLKIPESIRWMTDFPKAVEVGMALRIPLEGWKAGDRIESLTALGWMNDKSPEESANLLARLLENHRYKAGGMDLAPVGTPTNNTREEDAMLSPEEREEENAPDEAPTTGSDAQRLAKALGLPPDTFAGLGNSPSNSIEDARMLRKLLFPVTLSQSLSFWQPDVPEALKSELEAYFAEWVSGRGQHPALRVDDQPYAFLPALPFSQIATRQPYPEGSLRRKLWNNFLWPLHRWYEQQLPKVKRIERGLDAQEAQLNLLAILQLHPTSVAYRQRFALQPWGIQREQITDIFGLPETQIRADRAGESIQEQWNKAGLPEFIGLNQLLFANEARPILFENIQGEGLAEAVGEDVLLGAPGGIIPPLPGEQRHYLEWLEEVGMDNPNAQPPGEEPPYALLYHLLHHRLRQLPPEETETAKAVRDILKKIKNWPAPYLRPMVQEHLDCCTYRLDAWIGSYAAQRLEDLRAAPEENSKQPYRTGIQIGAWGYLEHLYPQSGEEEAEYIPAPSLQHATAAAVLRSSFQNDRSSEANDKLFAVDLSAERVKNALFLLEGVRNGQDLTALLGYRLERAMQSYRDEEGNPALAASIQKLRKRYRRKAIPLVQADQGSAPETEEDQSQAVIDALELLDDEQKEWEAIVGSNLKNALQAIVDDLDKQLDSVRDLLAAESVYQLAGGQMDRAKAALDAMTDGQQLQRPELVDQPRSSLPLTFRMGVLLHDRPLPVTGGAPSSLRAVVSPKLNRWLFDRLPDMGDIKVRVRWAQNPVDGAAADFQYDTLPLRHLFIEPIDLAYMMHLRRAKPEASELQYRIERAVRQQHDLPLDRRIEILEQDRTGFRSRDYTLFALEPLAAGLGKMLLETRCLHPKDFLQSNAAEREEAGKFWEPSFLRRQLRTAALQMENHQGSFEGRLANLAVRLNRGDAMSRQQIAWDLERLQEDLFFYAALGWVEAVPTAVDRLDRFVLEDYYRRASSFLNNARKRNQQARSLWKEGSEAPLSELLSSSSGQSPEEEVALLENIAELLFGKFYRLLPDFRLPKPADTDKALADEELQGSRQNFAVQRWIQTQAPLRPKMDLYYRADMLIDAFGGTKEREGYKLLQFPLRAGKTGPWVGQAYGDFLPHGDTMAMTLEVQSDFDLGHGTFSGLLIDEWQEEVPDPQANTGIALRYDQPDTEAPNAVLLALTLPGSAAWDWEALHTAVHDNLKLAKLRAIDPDILKESFLDQVLPAVLGPIYLQEDGQAGAESLLFGSMPNQRRQVDPPPVDIDDPDFENIDLGNTVD